MCACAAFRRIVSKSCSEIRMLNCLSFFIFPPFPLKWVRASARFGAFGREPVDRRLAKCDAGSSVGTGCISFASAASARAHPFRCASSKIAIALLDCDFALSARRCNVGFFCRAAHTTRSRGKKPHTAATRASRRGAGARRTRRVDRADFFHGRKIGTIGTFKGNPPLCRCCGRYPPESRFLLEPQRFPAPTA